MDNSNLGDSNTGIDPDSIILDSGAIVSNTEYKRLAEQELNLKKEVLDNIDGKKYAISKYLDNIYEQINRDRPDNDNMLLSNIESIKTQASENFKKEVELFIDYIDALYPSQYGNPIKEKPEEYEEAYLNVAIRQDSISFFVYDEIAKIINRNPNFQNTSIAQIIHDLSSNASRNSNNTQTIVDYLHNPTPAGRQNLINVITNNTTRKNQNIALIAQALGSIHPTYFEPISMLCQENQKTDMQRYSSFLNYIDFKVTNCVAVPTIDQNTKNDALFSFSSFFKRKS